jgi:hypothetical protein
VAHLLLFVFSVKITDLKSLYGGIMKKVKLFFIAVTFYFLLLPSISLASQILFAHVDGDGIYVDDGNRIRDMLISAGHTVNAVDLRNPFSIQS